MARALPGTDSELLALRLGFKVELFPMLPPGALAAIQRGQPLIYLQPDLDAAQRQLAIAHELGELTLAERLPERWHEWYCDRLADVLVYGTARGRPG